MSLEKKNTNQLLRQSMGYQGAVYTADTDAVTGDFVGFYVLEDAVFSALTAPNLTGAADVVTNTQSWPIGYYAIEMTAYTLTSGVIIAVKA